jgi:hypothetical protein
VLAILLAEGSLGFGIGFANRKTANRPVIPNAAATKKPDNKGRAFSW